MKPEDLRQARRLLDLVFGDDFSESDWENALGGSHVLAWHGEELVGHASVVQRRLLYRGKALRTGYVEALGAAPAHRRRGLGSQMMEVLEGVITRAFELGALSASDAAARLYRQRGWRVWQGPLSVLTPRGLERTAEEEGGIFVFPVAGELDVHEALVADFREGDIW